MEGIKFIYDHLNKMKHIQKTLLEFLEDEENEENHFNELIKKLNDLKIREDKYQTKETLHLISRISDNHCRNAYFMSRIERILKEFSKSMKKYFSNFEIFDIFHRNKRVLLYLFEEKIIIPDYSIFCIISTEKYKNRGYIQYFYTEFKSFFDEQLNEELKLNEQEFEDMEKFNQKRKKGENEKFVCELIRNDSIKDFIVYVNKNNLSLNTIIDPSMYETNLFLLKNHPSLIEYSAFYSAIEIFIYLQMNKVEYDENLWFYTIHGQNPQLIHNLEDNHIKPIDNTFYDCFKEALKCHHIDFVRYIKNNLIQTEKEIFAFSDYLHFYNFIMLCDQFIYDESEIIFYLCHFLYKNCDDKKNCNILFDICKYDYVYILDFLLKNTNVNTKIKKVVLNLICM